MDRARALIVAGVALVGCSNDAPPPHGEVLVVVDTDLPVPRVASRLRLDVYARDGRWFESRDLPRQSPEDFPVSFSVYSDDDFAVRSVFVRARVFPEGALRDYRGERFTTFGQPAPPAPDGFVPRLLDAQGIDRTPESEPDPGLAVDRLVEIPIRPAERSTLRITLHASCAGNMVDLGPTHSPVSGQSTSCVEVEGERVPVVPETLTPGIHDTKDSQATRSDQSCESPDSDRVCIPEGVFVLGSRRLLVFPDLPPVPERVVQISRFLLDAEEVTVGRYRAALAQGFVPAHPPTSNAGDLGPDFVNDGCTFTPSAADREDYALSCISALGAEEFCAFEGGRLPSEAEWEYAATSAGKLKASLFPWGDDAPDCARAVYGRLALSGIAGVCQAEGSGPVSSAAAPDDRSPLGVHDLAGGLAEWLRDDYAAYTDPCWLESSSLDPECHTSTPLRALRGGSWAAPPLTLRAAARFGATAEGSASFIGFRCSYPP